MERFFLPFAPQSTNFAKIRVMGIGGGGRNAIGSMISSGNIEGVDFVAVNTDAQALLLNKADTKIQIGEQFTKRSWIRRGTLNR